MVNKLFFMARVSLLALATPVLGYEAASTPKQEVLCIGSESMCREISKEEKNAVRLYAKIIKSLHAKQDDTVWPGYDISASPTIIHFTSGHIFAFDLKSDNPAWTQLKIGGYEVKFSNKDYWDLTNVPMHFSFPIDQEYAFVFQVDLDRDKADYAHRVFVHERFHRHQIEKFGPPDVGFGPYVDHINPRNLELVQLEEEILVDFFKAKETSHRKELLKDFLAVNKTRRTLIDPDSWKSEMHQQKIEGLADYVSLKTLDAFSLFDGFSGNKFLEHTLQSYANSQDFSDRTIKWRHYGVGATLGYALDFLQVPNWKKDVEENRETQIAILERNLSLTEKEITKRFEKVKSRYNFQALHQTVETALKEYQDHIDHLFQAFENQEGIVINLARPNVSLSAGGMNAELIYLADGSTLSIKDTTSVTSNDTFWKMKLDDIEFLFLNSQGIRKFKTTDDLIITLDGKQYTANQLLENGLKKPFKSLNMKSRDCDFSSEKHPGELIIKDKQIHVRYTNNSQGLRP